MNEFVLSKASRSNVKLKIGFWGPSGSGKTFSALRFAKGLVGSWDKIALIDTENGSGQLYSNLGDYNYMELKPPFSPKRYQQAINAIRNAGNIECLIIDSISHEWDGDGGCLELHTRAGGKFQDWSKITPMHKAFIDAILQAPFHVLVTGRTKIDYSIDKDDKNKTTIKKVGLKTITREGLDYEMTLAFSINIDHLALADKDRTGLFADLEIPFKIDETCGEKVLEWNKSAPIQKSISQKMDLPVKEKEEVNYIKKFTSLFSELSDKKQDRIDALKKMIPFDRNNNDQNYWKSLCDKISLIKPVDIDNFLKIDYSDITFDDLPAW